MRAFEQHKAATSHHTHYDLEIASKEDRYEVERANPAVNPARLARGRKYVLRRLLPMKAQRFQQTSITMRQADAARHVEQERYLAYSIGWRSEG
jgi:hypothetical protein